ncbi:DUF2628 domain-containing protein [Brevundimonas sp.]|uniref:DUF2628 domain-containing protein n=1 Tax=Brevundimonas sp. TaxID=1871086 RepID=UPI0025CE88A5|nr:DUF2628 domain-containing protein [Brevundimonas sp.]
MSDRWRVYGILFGVFAMLFAGLWLHAFLAVLGVVIVSIVTEVFMGIGPESPYYRLVDLLCLVGVAIYGGFIPQLRRRKLERAGWRRIDA